MNETTILCIYIENLALGLFLFEFLEVTFAERFQTIKMKKKHSAAI